jgi:hypothetical protein
VTLNNAGDDILLFDAFGAVVDSLRYRPGWHSPLVDNPHGRSLERINPGLPSTDERNWGTSADPAGGSPGRPNTLHTAIPVSEASLTSSPSPFSPDGDGIDDVTIIAYRLSAAFALVRIRIFDSAGRLVRILADGEPSAAAGRVVWDGMTDRRLRARMGIYVILLEAAGSDGGDVEKVKGLVVVAARL